MEQFHKALVIILLCDISRSSVIKDTKKDSTSFLPIPNPKYMRIEDPAHITVRWDPVEISEDHPILGFKVKLWEEKTKPVLTYVEKNGTLVLIEERVPVYKSIHEIPTYAPAFEAVVPANMSSASFDVERGKNYELRAQSFNKDGDGPLSIPHGFKIYSDEEQKLYESTTTERPKGEEDRVQITFID